jgi:DNA-binding MarR family transcriptional regulator
VGFVLTSSDPNAAPTADAVEVAGRLRYSVFRLARLLRQQDDSGHAPALLSALAVVEREGPLTLGELAVQEQVSPPTITKVVDTLESRGLVERNRDETDRRVCRVRSTARGRRQLEASRTRRTAWLATQLRGLEPTDLDRLAAALDVIEQLTKAPAPMREAP